jgi:hypothetical protein
MDSEILKALESLAIASTKPFCYGCYKEAPNGRCLTCGSDDLMRLMEGVGCEYGVDWVIKHILEENLEPANLEESFEQAIRDSYPETTKVGWMEFDTVTLMKEQDPVSLRCALSEYESNEESEGNIISLDNGSTYHWSQEVEGLA